MTGALLENVRVEGRPKLADAWAGGPRTFLGLMVAGFPNMVPITGPGSPSVKARMILAIEQHADWISGCLKHARAYGFYRVEADEAFQSKWVQHVNEVADSMPYPLANSWYVGANIPGKPRVFMPYVGGFDAYKRRCGDVAANDDKGFTMSQ